MMTTRDNSNADRWSTGSTHVAGKGKVVNLLCHAPGATQVCIAGDFNEWCPKASPMRRLPDGYWQAGLELADGCHQYVFVVDGKPGLIQTHCTPPAAAGKPKFYNPSFKTQEI